MIRCRCCPRWFVLTVWGVILPSALSQIIADDSPMKIHRSPLRGPLQSPRKRPLFPEDHILLGYGSKVDLVRRAIHQGVDIVTWSKWNLVVVETKGDSATSPTTEIISNLNTTAIAELQRDLDQEGYGNVLHLVSIAGWNGKHLDDRLTAEEWWEIWKAQVGHVFDGLDWDLEGDDDLTSPNNEYTIDCLNKMGEISNLAHRDGYYVTLAPPQSYLDFSDTEGRFSRFVNWTDPDRQYHPEFSYYGRSVFAYLLAKFGHTVFDLVAIQFYESFSRAAQAIHQQKQSAADYLVEYTKACASPSMSDAHCSLRVHFSQEPGFDLPDTVVELPLSKLLWGLSNGWSYVPPEQEDDKYFFASMNEVDRAWYRLHALQLPLPRGIMFWTINEEGRSGIMFAPVLRCILDGKDSHLHSGVCAGGQHAASFSTISRSHPQLPDRVLLGYGSEVDLVRRAVYNGVNVVAWSFLSIGFGELADNASPRGTIHTNLDLTAIKNLIEELREDGFTDVVHLVSTGGWNGGHLDERLTAEEWWGTFVSHVGDIFDGLDWDLEGNDNMTDTNNVFTKECLDQVGAISQLAKQGGYYITMAPPQSYLDWTDKEGRFSRCVNWTDPERQWHPEFSYYGRNVYAYLLAKFGWTIDLVSVQFYESYSRAAQSVYQIGDQPQTTPADYLVDYTNDCAKSPNRTCSMTVHFSADSEIDVPDLVVELPLSKLLWGLANGWALDPPSDKVFFASDHEVKQAWSRLRGRQPRGFMFWTINQEGLNGILLAAGLRKVLDDTTSAVV